MVRWLFLMCVLLCGVASVSWADERHDDDIDVTVAVDEEKVSVDVHLPVAASRELVWSVLTDFAHMASFISNVQESKVMSSQGDKLVVRQSGTARYGPLSYSFDSVREIQLVPWDTIVTKLISGSMRRMDGLTRLSGQGNLTQVDYHADSVPGQWIPPLFGKAFIAHELREQFQQMRDEIMRRKQRQEQ